MSTQRARSAVPADHRSILPNLPGAPWWGAVLIATTATVLGYAIEAGSGHKQLTNLFAALYIAGCVAAVLAVRQAGVFTAVIQPPLILFCAVPGAYWLFHDGKIHNIKDLLINCGYPLIERFPLMIGTAGGVLLIGMLRWYFGTTQRAVTAVDKTDTATAERRNLFSGISAKLSSLLGLHSDTAEVADTADEGADDPPRPARRTSRSTRTSRSDRKPARRTHSRHARPSVDDTDESGVERPRRPRRREQVPDRDFEPTDPPRRPRRRPRPQDDPELRAQSQRESRRDSQSRRSAYERPARRSSRFEPYDQYESTDPPERFSPYERERYERERYEPYERYESYEPRRRAASSKSAGATSANPTHHPISRVRYRGDAPSTEVRAEPRSSRRHRAPESRRPRHQAESWEYDI